MDTVTRAMRLETRVSKRFLESMEEAHRLGYESPEEIRQALRWGARKRVLLAWVQLQMLQRLTLRERLCIELYYFQGLTYAEVGLRTQTHSTSAFRAVERALRKLRQAAEEDCSWQERRPSRRIR